MARNRFRPALESLENRFVPAVTFQVVDIDSDGDKDLRILGNGENAEVRITEDPAANELLLSINHNGDADFTDPNDFVDRTLVATDGFHLTGGSIVLSLGAGNDKLLYAIENGDLVGVTRNLGFDLGAGHDVLHLVSNFNRLVGCDINLAILTRGGADFVNLDFVGASATDANIDHTNLTINAAMAGGPWDIFTLDLTNRVGNTAFDSVDNGSVVDVNVDGGAGLNRCQLELDNVGDTAQASFAMEYLGSNDAGTDSLWWNLLGDVGNSSVIDLKATLQGGNDVFASQLNPGTFDLEHASAQVKYWVDGGAGNDRIGLTANDRNLGPYVMELAGLLDVTFLGGTGNDRFDLDFAVSYQFNLTGTLKLRVAGGAGHDRFGEPTLVISNTAISTGVYDVLIAGDAGNDRMHFSLNKAGAPVTFGTAGAIVLDGGTGIDRLVNGAPPLSDIVATLFEQFGP